jgi:hypothetical protein
LHFRDRILTIAEHSIPPENALLGVSLGVSPPLSEVDTPNAANGPENTQSQD